MKKKLLSVLMLALSLVTLIALAACGGGKSLKITPREPEYDVGIGGDLSVTVSLGEEKITRVKDGDVVVDNAEYLVEGEKLTIYESYMLYLDLGEHVFTVTTDTKEGKFTVKVVNNVVTTFDETDKNYTYGSSGDLVIDADLSTAKIYSVKAGERKLTADDYSYDGTAHKFTIKNAFLQTLYGTTEFKVELSNNTAHTFNVISDCMFTANFDDEYVPNFYNDNAGKVTEGWNGTNALHWTGNTGNIMLFHLGEHGFGMTLDFDAEKLYELSFKLKNNWTDESANPAGFLNMAIDGRGEVFWANYLTGRCDGGCATVDNDGVWSVKIYFKGLTGKEFISMYSGYDPTRPNTKLFDLLFDDIVLNEVTVEEPTMADAEKTVSRGSNTGDAWFDGAFGLRNVTSVKVDGEELDKGNYFTATSSVVLRKDYLNTLTEDTTYTVTFEDGKSVQFTVKMGKSEPTTFDEEVDRVYRIGGGDISFNINLRGFEIKHIKYTGTDTTVPTSAYEVKDGKLIIKHAFLDTLVGENGFTITVDNAGWLEGTTDAGTHTFNITTNAVVNKRFDDIAAGTSVSGDGERLDGLNGFGCNGSSSIVAGFDGNVWQLTNGNGGNFMRIKNSQAATDAGDAYLAQLTDGTLYNLSFDVKYVSAKGSSDGNGENVAFEMHLFTTESGYYTLNFNANGVLTCISPNVIITDKSGGVYNVSVRFAFNYEGNGNGGKAGVLGLEAVGWQSVWYTIQLDNVVMIEVPLDNTATYVYNSNQDVVYNVTFDSVKKIEANGKALSSELYSVAEGKLTVKAAFAQTVAGSANLVVTLTDDSTETFILESTLMASIDFESDFDDSVMVKAWGGSPNEVATSGIDGKTWRYGNKGGNFMAFVTNLKDTPYGTNPGIRLALKDGETYRLCFDIKLESAVLEGTETAYIGDLSFALHGTGTHASMTFGSTHALTSTDEHVKIVAGDNGVYHVEFTFVYSANGTGGCNGNLDGCGGCVHLDGSDSWGKGVNYVLLMDNIQMIYEAQA